MARRVILLQAEDTTGKEGLWESDGTTAGTFEIHPSVTISPSGFLLNPPSFANLKGKVYFDGLDFVNNGSHPNLWVTDGTSAGTVELSVAGAFSSGLAPSYLTTFGNKIVFEGIDSNQKHNLWVTDGTGVGTVELTANGQNVTAGGLFTASSIAPYFTVYNGVVLFEGYDTSGNYGLWTTDGTSGGTKELVIPGAASGGIFAQTDPHFALLPTGVVIFTGTDAATGQTALFTTDGTGAGTHEIAGTAGIPYNAATTTGRAMAVLNGQAYFKGEDGSVWVSDGTTNGTHSLGPIAGAFSNGTDIQPTGFVTLGSRVLFAGSDTNDQVVLWSTDGTAGGTFKINAPGSATNFVPTYIDAANGFAEFAGLDTSGKWGLWVTDGVNAATELSPAGANTGPAGLFPNYMTTVTLGAAVGGDFNGDGNSDQIFENGSTFTEWQSTGNSFTANVYVNSIGAGWSLAGIGDFNSDGMSDLIFQNGGTYTEWQSSGSSFTQNVSVFVVGAGWNLVGAGDFSGDSKCDLIFQNGATFTEWQSSGNSFTQNVYVNSVGAGWSLAGVGDFNGDGKSDLIWQNGGTFTEWQATASGTSNSFAQNVYVNSVGAGWTLAGVGDFNGDGKSDLIWENGGTFTEWQSNGNGFTQNVYVNSLGAGWSVAAIGDFNGDGLSDILFRNTNGTFSEWQSTGSGFSQNVLVNSTVGNAWTVEYSSTGASRSPGAPAGLTASSTAATSESSGGVISGTMTTDTTIGALNQQSSLAPSPDHLFASHSA